MSSSEKYLTQVQQWLAENDEDHDAELCIDLPEVGWIKVHSLVEADGIVTCQYTNAARFVIPETIMFPIHKISAARRSKSAASYFRTTAR